MAHLCPHDLPREFQVDAPTAEIETLVELRRHLDDRFIVFHGVHWTNEHRKFTIYGEIDFVVISPAGRIVVIEQKNGQLEETPTGLTKHYRGYSKEVSSQIQRSIHNIRTKFSRLHAGEGLDVDYLIYCPDYQLRGVLSAALHENRIVHAGNRDEMTARIEALLSEPVEEDCEKAARVEAFFTASFGLIPDIHAHGSVQDKQFVRLTEGLATVIGNIEMKPLRLRVQGTAGCGKSLVALRMFEKALTAGKRPLLVCFNRPLAMKLKASVPTFEATYSGKKAEILGAYALDSSYRRVYEQASPDACLLRFSNHKNYKCFSQKAAVRAIMTMPEGAGLMVSMPTGTGKSLLFQIAPKVWKEDNECPCVVVITPTVALALDHERTLAGIPGLEASRALTGQLSVPLPE